MVLQEEVLEKVFEILKLLKAATGRWKSFWRRLGDYVDNLRMEQELHETERRSSGETGKNTVRSAKALDLLESITDYF